VRCEDLHKVFQGRQGLGGRGREVHAVKGVSLSVTEGGSLGIVGESGSGKTTVARMIVGSEKPTSGWVQIDGYPITTSTSRRARLRRSRLTQMVFQDPFTSLDPRQSLRATLDEVQRVHFRRSQLERQNRTAELCEAVNLGGREMRALPHELSGGQRQRAAIARALAAEPRIIVLDEAVSALDVSIQAQILNLLADLRKQFRLTYILVSHDLAVVRHITDDLIVMYRGELLESGPVDAVLAAPAHPYTIRLLESVPQPGMELTQRTTRAVEMEGGCPFRSRCPVVESRCVNSPPLRSVGETHRTRCWRAAEVGEAVTAAEPAASSPDGNRCL
jgi:peptide/nickel transport system ATP-binding protein